MTADLSAEARNVRFGERAKFLPVAFVVVNIVGLWVVYMFYFLTDLLKKEETHSYGMTLMVIFNVDTLLLLICYVRCILVHPGTIPDSSEDPSWEYAAQDARAAPQAQVTNLQEAKRSGDRRHCKWCAKYKPDRCHHCRVCRTCILRMDHHCPWIYNCVGFRNHKYFFLLLLYTTIDTHLIFWTMLPAVMASVDADIPFMSMFMLLFGETLAAFLGLLVTVFFCFHIWLMLKAMSTIEFCEKSMKKSGYDGSIYDRGLCGNIRSVLGDNMLLWLLPVCPPSGRGLSFVAEETKLNRDMEPGRGIRRSLNPGQGAYAPHGPRREYRHRAAGTGSAPSSGASCQDDDEDRLSEGSACGRDAPFRQGPVFSGQGPYSKSGYGV